MWIDEMIVELAQTLLYALQKNEKWQQAWCKFVVCVAGASKLSYIMQAISLYKLSHLCYCFNTNIYIYILL